MFAGCLLHIVCRFFTGCLQIICRLFPVRDSFLDFSNDSMLFLTNFRDSKKTCYGRTDRWTDGQTLIYRDAWTHLINQWNLCEPETNKSSQSRQFGLQTWDVVVALGNVAQWVEVSGKSLCRLNNKQCHLNNKPYRSNNRWFIGKK